MPATSKGYNILARFYFLHIHHYFDSLFNRELQKNRKILMPFGLAIRGTEMISIILLISTLSRTDIHKER